jgi:hypothetical protein
VDKYEPCDQCGGLCCQVCGICKDCDGNECGVHAAVHPAVAGLSARELGDLGARNYTAILMAISVVPEAFVTLPDVGSDAKSLTVPQFTAKYRQYIR